MLDGTEKPIKFSINGIAVMLKPFIFIFFISFNLLAQPISNLMVGGLDSLHNIVKYPEEASKNHIVGIVKVVVIIDTLGRIDTSFIIESDKLGYGCDEEALIKVNSMKFLPYYSNEQKQYISATGRIHVYFPPSRYLSEKKRMKY